jgi:hypothetical protein
MGFALTAEWLLKVMNGFRGANFHIIEGILKAELQMFGVSANNFVQTIVW